MRRGEHQRGELDAPAERHVPSLADLQRELHLLALEDLIGKHPAALGRIRTATERGEHRDGLRDRCRVRDLSHRGDVSLLMSVDWRAATRRSGTRSGMSGYRHQRFNRLFANLFFRDLSRLFIIDMRVQVPLLAQIDRKSRGNPAFSCLLPGGTGPPVVRRKCLELPEVFGLRDSRSVFRQTYRGLRGASQGSEPSDEPADSRCGRADSTLSTPLVSLRQRGSTPQARPSRRALRFRLLGVGPLAVERERERPVVAVVPDRLVPPQPLGEHPRQHRDVAIDVVVDAHLELALVQTVQSSRVLHDRPLPRDRHRQEQRVQPGVVEPLTEEAARRQHQPLLPRGHRRQTRHLLAPRLRAKPTVEHDRVRREPPQPRSQHFEVLASLREYHRRSPLHERADDILHDERVARRIRDQRGVHLLDAPRRACAIDAKPCLPREQPLLERLPRRRAPRVDRMAHRTALHEQDRVVSVAAVRRRAQPDDVAGGSRAHHPLKRKRWDVMALVDQHVAVLPDAVIDLAAAHQALDHRDVESSVESRTSAAERADLRRVESEEACELRDPLIYQRLAMDEHQRTAGASGDEPCTDDRLPAAGRRHEDPGVVGRQRAHRVFLDGQELPVEPDVERFTHVAAILDHKRRAVLASELRERVLAAAWERDVLRMLLEAPDDSRRSPGRESHRLPLVELRVVKGREPLDPMHERRRQRLDRHVQTLRDNGVNRRRQGHQEARSWRAAGRRLRPRRAVGLLVRHVEVGAQHAPRPDGLRCELLDASGRDPLDRREERPLIGVRRESLVEELRVARGASGVLERQRDEVAESPARHRVLVGEQPVVGAEREVMAPGHGLGKEEAAHPPGGDRRNRGGEEEPRVRTVAGARSLDGHGHAEVFAGLAEGRDVARPRVLVEVRREEPARLVGQERIHAHDVLPPQVGDHHAVFDTHERLVLAGTASDARLLADAEAPLVGADGRVALDPRLAVDPELGEDVFATAEERSKQRDLATDARRRRDDLHEGQRSLPRTGIGRWDQLVDLSVGRNPGHHGVAVSASEGCAVTFPRHLLGDDTHHERRAAPDDGVHLRLAQRLPPAGLAGGPPRGLDVHPAARPGVRCRRGLQRVRRPVTPFGSRAPIAVAWSHAARADH